MSAHEVTKAEIERLRAQVAAVAALADDMADKAYRAQVSANARTGMPDYEQLREYANTLSKWSERFIAALDDPDTALRGVRAEALEEFASRQFEMAQAWGHDVTWITSGTKVAELVADWAKEAARIARAGGEG